MVGCLERSQVTLSDGLKDPDGSIAKEGLC